MRILCTDCGEEVLGSANRCWQCGRDFPLGPDEDGLPPIRQIPVPELPGVMGQLAANSMSAATPTLAAEANKTSPVQGRITTKTRSPQGAFPNDKPRLRFNWIGLAAFSVGVLTVWLILPAVLASIIGMSLSLVAFNSPRRGLALAALLLTTIALAISGFLLLVEVYASIVGVHPFLEPPMQLPPDDLSEDLFE